MKSVITGRRASQGADRANLPPLEVDSTGLLKLNPLFAWTFPFVEWYVKENNVPRNKLLDQGYRSVGDWHSTAKSGDGDTGERAGRWAGKKEKTECGLHVDYFAMKAAAEKKVRAIVLVPCWPEAHAVRDMQLEQLQTKGETRAEEATATAVPTVQASA